MTSDEQAANAGPSPRREDSHGNEVVFGPAHEATDGGSDGGAEGPAGSGPGGASGGDVVRGPSHEAADGQAP
jgi:hypothetical protein